MPVSVIALLFCGTSLHAQAPVLTLDSAVARALRTYPAITAAELEVRQQEALKKTALQLQPLSAQLQGGQINSAANDINLQATTGLPFPTAIAQRSRYLKESVKLAESDRTRIHAAVRESAAGAYLQWAMGMERARLLQHNDSAMQTLALFAARKFDAGATGRLEKVSAQSAADQARLAWNRSRSDIAVYAAELEQWTGPLNGALPDSVLLRSLSMQPDPSAGAAPNDPVLATAAQQAELAKAEWKMERSQWAPTLQGGGFYQTIDGVSPFGGFLIGTAIPLPGGGQGARTKAARLRSDIARQQLEELRRSRTTELARTRAQWAQLHESLAYYEGNGAALAEALRRDAQRAYLNGEAGYVEFLQGMDQARTIEEERLGVRFQTALTVIHLNALTGQ